MNGQSWRIAGAIVLSVGTIVVEITMPDGTVLDVSDRTSLDDIGSISETLEDDLLVLTHGDLDLVLYDQDGSLATMLRESSRDETWELHVRRYNGLRRIKWDLLFAGILDTPVTVEIDRKQRTVGVQAFSFSKLLERVDVEALRRDAGHAFPDILAGQKANATAGTHQVDLEPGYSLASEANRSLRNGDRIVLDDGTNREEHVVHNNQSNDVFSTHLYTLEPIENTYVGASIELLTPWPWHQTVREIAEALLGSLGIDVEIDLDNAEARVPFASGFDNAGLFGTSLGFNALLPRASLTDTQVLRAWMAGLPQDADSPSSGFEIAGGSATAQGDWTPYLASEPVSLETVPTEVQGGGALGRLGGGHVGDDVQLNLTPVSYDDLDWVAAYDHEGGFTYTLRQRHALVTNDPQIRLYRDGTLVVGVASAAGNTPDQFHAAYLDWFERSAHGFTDDIAVVSTQAHDGTRNLHVVNLGAGTSHTIVTGDGGGGGGVRTLGDRGQVAVQQAATDDLNQPNIPATIGFWQPAADGTYLTLDRTIAGQPAMQMWTMRSFGDFIACMYLAGAPTPASSTGFQKRATRCRVWRWDTLEQVSDFEVAPYAHPQMYATRVTIAGIPSLVLAVNRYMSVLCTSFVGTVPYINFDDISAERALRDVAVLSLAYLHVSPDKTARIIARASESGAEHDLDHESLIEDLELPLTGSFAESIEVQGRDSSGAEFTVVVPRGSHDSAHRVSIESSLIRDAGLGESMGAAYYDLLGGARGERQIEAELRPGAPIRAIDRVILEGHRYRPVSVETDLDREIQAVRLVEILADQ